MSTVDVQCILLRILLLYVLTVLMLNFNSVAMSLGRRPAASIRRTLHSRAESSLCPAGTGRALVAPSVHESGLGKYFFPASTFRMAMTNLARGSSLPL